MARGSLVDIQSMVEKLDLIIQVGNKKVEEAAKKEGVEAAEKSVEEAAKEEENLHRCSQELYQITRVTSQTPQGSQHPKTNRLHVESSDKK
jgi:hypothetical protein